MRIIEESFAINITHHQKKSIYISVCILWPSGTLVIICPLAARNICSIFTNTDCISFNARGFSNEHIHTHRCACSQMQNMEKKNFY